MPTVPLQASARAAGGSDPDRPFLHGPIRARTRVAGPGSATARRRGRGGPGPACGAGGRGGRGLRLAEDLGHEHQRGERRVLDQGQQRVAEGRYGDAGRLRQHDPPQHLALGHADGLRGLMVVRHRAQSTPRARLLKKQGQRRHQRSGNAGGDHETE